MKHKYMVYHSEKDALQAICEISELNTEKIKKPYHHKERVRKYHEIALVKKQRSLTPRAIARAYEEANAYAALSDIGVNVPYLYGVLHSEEECSLLLQYVESDPLTCLLILPDLQLPETLNLTGRELGKMFDSSFLHGDLTSYHIFTDGKVYLFDLESTRRFQEDEFYRRLITEWTKFIDSTQGRRWRIPITREQEEMIFEGVKETLENKKTLSVIEKVVLQRK